MDEKWIVRKIDLLLLLYITETEQCLLIYKKEIGKSKRAVA